MSDGSSIIRFPCKCGHLFEVPLDMAAQSIQCPACGLLADVPTLSDLSSVDEDGTLSLKPQDVRSEPGRLAELTRTFGRDHLDDSGQEKDLRLAPEQLRGIGAGEVPYKQEETFSRLAPRYDPETGELLKPLDVDDATPGSSTPAQPVPVAKRVLTYAAATESSIWSFGKLMLELCQPVNIAVMLFVILLHILLQPLTFMMLGGLFIFAPAVIVLVVAILAHYGNTIDETGRELRDELPRPFRGLSFGEDLWHPFTHVAGSILICYGPAIVAAPASAYDWMPWRLVLSLALLAPGTFLFPAVLLTISTSGAFENLRPDRLMRVISVAGWHYARSVLLWVIAATAYSLALFMLLMQIARLAGPPSAKPLLGHWALVYPVMMIAMFVVHLFCWDLGLIYRRYHDRFEWVLQHFIKKQRAGVSDTRKAALPPPKRESRLQ